MQFRGLTAFCAAARLHSFKDAADELCITPSAVSHQIRDLEAFLGVKLFERQPRTIVLTDTGRTLFEEIEPHIRCIQAATSRVRRQPSRTLLTVQMPEFFASELFVPCINVFSARHEHIDLRLETMGPGDAPHAGGDVDIVLTRHAPDGGRRLFPIRYVPACSASRHACLSARGFDALDEATLLVHQARPHAWHQWAELAGVRAPHPKQVIRLDSMFALARATEEGTGIALIPMPISARWFESGAIQRLFAQDLVTADYYFVVAASEGRNPDAAELLVQWVVATFTNYT